MGMLSAVALGVLLAAGPQPVYKCQEKGAITYTDRPCSRTAEPADLPRIVVTAPPARVQLDLARDWDARLERETAERDRADAEWLQRHAAEQQAAAAPKGQAKAKPKPKQRRAR